MTIDALLAELRSAIGRRNVWTGAKATRSYRHGYRFGFGPCLAVAAPTSLMAMWRALEACISANAIVILQASNTGLTGGSTPDGEYDRDVVIISTRKLTGVRPIRGGQQVLCRPGATLHELERTQIWLRAFAALRHLFSFSGLAAALRSVGRDTVHG
jgi:D-lactate dehydrogenase (quinone)